MSNCEGQYWSGMKLLLPSIKLHLYLVWKYDFVQEGIYWTAAALCWLWKYPPWLLVLLCSGGNWIQKYLCSGISPNWEMKRQVMLSECRISTSNFMEEEESQKRKNMELQCLKTNIFPCKQSRWLDLVNQAFIHLCQYQIFKIFSCLHKSQFVQFASQKFSRL